MQQVEIHIKGHIGLDWSDWLGGLSITQTEKGETVLAGTLRDQAALHGLLDRLADLGLELLSVTAVESQTDLSFLAKEGRKA